MDIFLDIVYQRFFMSINSNLIWFIATIKKHKTFAVDNESLMYK